MVRSSTSKKKKMAPAKKAASKKKVAKKVAKKTAPRKKAEVAPTLELHAAPLLPSELAEVPKLLRGVISAITNLTNTVTQLANGAAIDREESTHADIEASDTVAAKTKKPRKTKTVDVADSPEAVAANAGNGAATNDPFAVGAGQSGNTVTKDQINAALQQVSATHGLNRVKEVLTKFNADRMSSIKEDDYEAVVTYCTQICGEAAAPASSVF